MQNNPTSNKDFSMELNSTIINNFPEVIAANNKYIIFKTDNSQINIIDILNNSSPITIQYSRYLIVKFHPNYNRIFLFADKYGLKIYEIKKDKFELEKKIIINEPTQNINIAEFSKTDDKTIATCSQNSIKVWNFKESFNICNILLNDKANIIAMQIYKNFIFYFDALESIITKYDFITFEKIKEYKVVSPKFIIISENKILSIKNFIISIDDNDSKEELKISQNCLNTFHDDKLQLLYLCYFHKIDVIDIKTMKIIFTYKDKETMTKFFFFNNISEETKYANFSIYKNDKIEFYSFCSKDNILKKKIEKLLILDEKFWDGVIPKISDINILKWEFNDKEELEYKKYLNIQDINDLIYSNCKLTLEEVKSKVPVNIKEFEKLDYINILKLIVSDNTNKDLIAHYLKFIEKNQADLLSKYNEIDTFESEYENYKMMFEKDELKLRNLREKDIDEKKNFLNLLDKIINLDVKNNDILRSEVTNKIKKLNLFNQPIDLSNTELYWYRNLFIVYFGLNKLFRKKKEKLELKLEMMQKTIKRIMDKNIFNKDYIIKNKTLLNSILILIVKPQNDNIVEFNLNLLESADKDYNYNKELKISNLYQSKQYKNAYDLDYKGINHTLFEPSQSCIKNFVLNFDKQMNLDENEIKNHNEMIKYYDEIINFNEMKLFLSKIFTSTTIIEAFELLYPKDFSFPFTSQKKAYEFLNKYYHFIPLKITGLAAVTEKFSLEIYYILRHRKICISEINSREINLLIKKILYRGSCVKSSCHEINHEFYNIFFKHLNGLIPLETPRKKYIKENEGGKNIERLLFGQPLHVLALSQCLYLLNEKNYQKKLSDFRSGFNELKSEDLKIEDDSLFKEFNTVLNIKNFDNIKVNSNIRCDDEEDENNDEENDDTYENKINAFLNKFADIYIGDIEDDDDVF